MLTVARNSAAFRAVERVVEQAGLRVEVHQPLAPIPGTYWGEPEAGLVGCTVHVRPDTPIHSLLHEACHAICMSTERRSGLVRDAGGDDIEESAVCYLQLCIASCVQSIGVLCLADDMDAWGYSFRAGNTLSWFERDSADAKAWLLDHEEIRSLVPAHVWQCVVAVPGAIAC